MWKHSAWTRSPRLLSLEMKRDRTGWWLTFGRGGVAGDEGQAALTRPEPVATQDLEDAGGGDLELAEGVGLGQLGGQPART